MASVGILSQIKLLLGLLVIQLVWYIVKQLFTSVLVKVVDIYQGTISYEMKFLPPFCSRNRKSMLHWFIIFEFKLWSRMQNSFSIPPKLAKNAVVVFWGLELKWRHKVCKVRLLHFEPVYFLQSWHSLSRLFGGFIQWKMSSNDELSSDTSSSCDAESLQLAVEGKGSFNSIIQH